jgi:hypothetical protein
MGEGTVNGGHLSVATLRRARREAAADRPVPGGSRAERGSGAEGVAMSVPDALSLAADQLDPLTPPPRPPWLDGREPVMVPTGEARLAAVCAILRDTWGLPSVAAAQGVPVGELERLAALDSDYGSWW